LKAAPACRSVVVVRVANTLVAALALVVPVACDGDGEAAAPVPVAQRFLTAEDAPGSTPDPVETGRTAADLDEFIAGFEFAVEPDEEEMSTVFQEAGFKGAGEDTRFLGETHTPKAPHLISLFIELGSDDGAKDALDWLEADSMKPCPESCAVQISSFDPEGIADARGVRRLSTARLIETAGTPNQVPRDDYWIGFTGGSFVYTMVLFGPPGSVSVEQAQEIARAYHDRLTGS
jgi:hypothetical protein